MFAGSFHTCGETQQVVLRKARGDDDGNDFRLAFGQRTRLVDHQRVDFLHPLESFGVLDQDSGLRATADADHDRHGRGEPEGTGTGDDEHAHGGDETEGKPRLRSEQRPGAEGNYCRRNYSRHEPACDLVGQPLNRSARALRLRDHLDDLGKQRVAPDLFGPHHESAGLIERARDDLGADVLRDGHGLAGHQRLVQG